MSLIITSNQIEDGIDEDGVGQEPYMYRNYMKQPLIIPKDSEVSVQSVKFSRDETITIRPGDKWFQMYNINLEKLDDGRTSNDTTGYPIECVIETDDDKVENVSLEVLIERISRAMKRGFPHPDIYGVLVDTDITPICKSYFSGVDTFAGFSLRQTSEETAEDLDIIPQTITKNYPDADPTLTWDNLQRLVKAPDVAYPTDPEKDNEIDMVGVMTDYPISHYKGNMRIDIGGICKDETDFEVDTQTAFGLVRSFPKDVESYDAIQPTYFNDYPEGAGGTGQPGGIRNAGNTQFFDYAIRIEPKGVNAGEADNNVLKIVCSCKDQDDLNMTCMKEIEYWGWAEPYPGVAPAFSTQYDMTTNSAKINQFLIRTEGEQVLFYYHTGALSTKPNPLDDSGWKLFCGFSMGQGYYDKTYNKAIPTPMNQNNWNLYPLFFISAKKVNLTAGGTTEGKLKLSAFSGRDIKDYDYNEDDNDWWARNNNNDTEDKGPLQVDTRTKFNDPYDATEFYTQLATATYGAVKDYVWAFILRPDDKYYLPTNGANADKLLGFDNTTILRPDKIGSAYDGSYGWKYDSVHIPPLISDSSLFIRLDNFTQKTLNSAVARPSKILYCCPRFDSSGRSSGDGLFFEPHERVYVKLGNPTEININEFDISICDVGERLAKSLKGQTIVNLHIRENQTGMRQAEYLKREKDEGVMIF